MKGLKLVDRSPELSYPWGYIFREDPPESVRKASEIIGNSPIVTVGDVVSRNFSRYYRTDMSVIDYRTRRKKIEAWLGEKHFFCKNPAGMVTIECVNAVSRLLRRGKGVLVVDGEEDLLAIPVLSLCENGYVVYGNWRGFLQVIPCTPFFRLKAVGLLKRNFTPV